MRSRILVAALAAALLVSACSSDAGSDGKDGKGAKTATTAKGGKGGSAFTPVTWNAAVADPCKLLRLVDVKKAIPKGDAKPMAASPRSCRYQLADNRSAGLDLLFPQTDASYASRTAGAPDYGDEGMKLAFLVSPGTGLWVRKGNAAALVTVRSSVGADVASRRQAQALAELIAERLPKAPTPSKSILERDLCDVVPAKTFGKATTGDDVTGPLVCGYRLADQTTIQFQVAPKPENGSTPLVGKPWAEGGKGAVWQGPTAGPGGSGQGTVPLSSGTLLISLASPVRGRADLQKLGAQVADLVRKAAG